MPQQSRRSGMSILRAAAVVGMVLGTAVAQQQKTTQTSYGLDDVNSKDLTKEGLCKQAYHQSAIFGDKLYIVGGAVRYNDGGVGSTLVPNTLMRTLDLTKSVRLAENTSNPFEATYLDPGVPSIASGALWADTKANTLRLVPGTGSLGMAASDLSAPTVKNYVEPKLDEVWNYDLGKKRWAMDKVELDPSAMFGKDQASVWVDKVRKGFLLGGAHGVHDTYEALTDVLPGHLITYDADTGIWTNETTNFPAPRFGASMVYVEGVGKQGALVVMVGMGMGYKKSTEKVDYVDVYDIASKEWYRQKTTGARPFVRNGPCLIATTAPDNSSYNIAFYGGGHRPQGKEPQLFGQTHVLSLPSFQWVLGNEEQNSKNFYATGENEKMTCHLVNGRQMLVIGGRSKLPFNQGACSAKQGQLSVMDLSTFTWQEVFEPTFKEYKVPAVISNVIGGDSDGGATVTEPEGGFMEAGLKAMFDGTSPDPLPDSSSSSSSKNSKSSKSSSSSGSGSSSSSDSDSESKPAPLGAIIGGVVGGVVAIAIIGALFFFLRRRKQNKLKSSASMELEGSGHPQHALAAAHNHQPQYPHTIASEIMTNDKNQSQYHPHYPQTTASEIMTNDKTDYAQYAAIEVQEMPDPHSKLAYPEPKELPASEPWDPTRATNTAPMAPVRYSATDIGTPPPPMSPPPGWSAPSGFGVSDGEHTVPGSNRADEIGGNYAGPGGFPGSGPGSAHKDMPNFHYR